MTPTVPPLVIILLTYGGSPERTGYARRTIQAMRQNFRYGGDALWYVADDGSPREHLDAVREELAGAPMLGWHSERAGYGANANRAWAASRDVTELTLWLEDDWSLSRETDFTQYAEALQADTRLGMIRLANMIEGLHGELLNVCDRHYLAIHWQQPYVFSGNPAMRHWRAREAWGAYPEGLGPGDTEVAYDWRVSRAKGPRIAWPIDIGGWGLFGHHGTIKSYA